MLDGIWQFLNDEGPIISSIAAIVAIAAGIWKFVVLFSKKIEKAPQRRLSKQVAAGLRLAVT